MVAGERALTEPDVPTDDAPRSDDAPRVVEWTSDPVGALLGDWLVELYPRDGSTETDVD